MAYRTTNPAGAKQLFDAEDETCFIDVRTVEEFDSGHVPGAYNVPLMFRTPAGMEPNPEFAPAIERLFQQKAKLVLY